MLLLMLTGCNYESMSPSWLIDRTRILGVQAEVAGEPGLAEPRPGDRVGFRSLTAVYLTAVLRTGAEEAAHTTLVGFKADEDL